MLFNKNKIKLAFTLAEALIVMTVLGIIGVIMITNLNPGEFRDKSLAVLAQKDIEQVNQAFKKIILQHSQDKTLEKLYELDSTTTFNFFEDMKKAEPLFKKYIATTRNSTDVNGDGILDGRDTIKLQKENYEANFTSCVLLKLIDAALLFGLKDGSTLCIGSNENNLEDTLTMLPEETTPCKTSSALGYVYIDANGLKEGPNILGKDIFVVPLNKKGMAFNIQCD